MDNGDVGMKMIYMCLVVMAIAFTACSEGKKPNASEAERNKAYRMPDDLLASKRELKLSELADSVWYVPLETTPQCILAEKFDHFRYKNNTFGMRLSGFVDRFGRGRCLP